MNGGPTIHGRRSAFEKSNTELINSLRANFSLAQQSNIHTKTPPPTTTTATPAALRPVRDLRLYINVCPWPVLFLAASDKLHLLISAPIVCRSTRDPPRLSSVQRRCCQRDRPTSSQLQKATRP